MQRSLSISGMTSSERTSSTHVDVARILGHVADQHRLAVQRGVADQAFGQRERAAARIASPKATETLTLEPLLVVEQQHAEASGSR